MPHSVHQRLQREFLTLFEWTTVVDVVTMTSVEDNQKTNVSQQVPTLGL